MQFGLEGQLSCLSVTLPVAPRQPDSRPPPTLSPFIKEMSGKRNSNCAELYLYTLPFDKVLGLGLVSYRLKSMLWVLGDATTAE